MNVAVRIGRLALGLVQAAVVCAVHAAPYAYVANTNYGGPSGNTISVIDTATNAVVTRIPVPEWPIDVVVDRQSALVYVTLYRGEPPQPGSVIVINALTSALIDIINGLGPNPRRPVLNAAGTLLYTFCEDGTIYVIDTTTRTIVKSIPRPPSVPAPSALALDPSETRLYVTYAYAHNVPGFVRIVDVASGVFIGSAIDVDSGPTDIAFNPAGTQVYVVNNSGAVSVIDVASSAVTASIPIAIVGPPGESSVPQFLVFNSAGTRAYVTTAGLFSGTVAVVDTASRTVVARVSLNGRPNGIALHPSGSLAYVTNNTEDGTSNVQAISTATNTVTATIPVAFIAFGIAVLPLPPPTASCPGGNARTKPDGLYTVEAALQVVTDTSTALMWKQCSEGLSGASCATGAASVMTWASALTAAATSNHAGYSDWRLPNAKELESLVETGCYIPSINRNVFPATPPSPYWSSTTDAKTPSYAWYIDFGNVANINFSTDKAGAGGPQYVRLVRGGQPMDAFDRAVDRTPDAFSFAAKTGVATNSTVSSNPVTLTGFSTAIGIAISGGSNARYRVNGGPYTALPGVVVSGDIVTVQQTSSAGANTTTSATLTVGAVSGDFSVTTAPAPTASRAFVSSYGNDTNICSLVAPCRSLGSAIARVFSGGEVIVIDAAGYGPVTITNSISITAPPGVYAGITVSTDAGVVVNAPAGTVTLRGLTLNNLGSGNTIGIDFQAGAALYLERMSINGFAGAGVSAASGDVHMIDSIFRDNKKGLALASAPAVAATRAFVERTRFERNTIGISVSSAGAAIRLDRVSLADGNWGIFQQPLLTGGTSAVQVRNSRITGNAASGVLVGGGGGSASTLSMVGSHLSDNGIALDVQAGGAAVVSNSTITNNVTGISFVSGTVVSLGDNRVTGNGADGSFSSTVPRQ